MSLNNYYHSNCIVYNTAYFNYYFNRFNSNFLIFISIIPQLPLKWHFSNILNFPKGYCTIIISLSCICWKYFQIWSTNHHTQHRQTGVARYESVTAFFHVCRLKFYNQNPQKSNLARYFSALAAYTLRPWDPTSGPTPNTSRTFLPIVSNPKVTEWCVGLQPPDHITIDTRGCNNRWCAFIFNCAGKSASVTLVTYSCARPLLGTAGTDVTPIYRMPVPWACAARFTLPMTSPKRKSAATYGTGQVCGSWRLHGGEVGLS